MCFQLFILNIHTINPPSPIIKVTTMQQQFLTPFFFRLKCYSWLETMIPQRKIVSDIGKMVLQPRLPPPPTVSPPPPIVSPQSQLHLRAKSLLQKLFQMIQVTVPNFFYFDVISKIRPLEPKIHLFLSGDSRRRSGDNRRRRGKIEMVLKAKII